MKIRAGKKNFLPGSTTLRKKFPADNGVFFGAKFAMVFNSSSNVCHSGTWALRFPSNF
jgi:hypothetical protein